MLTAPCGAEDIGCTQAQARSRPDLSRVIFRGPGSQQYNAATTCTARAPDFHVNRLADLLARAFAAIAHACTSPSRASLQAPHASRHQGQRISHVRKYAAHWLLSLHRLQPAANSDKWRSRCFFDSRRATLSLQAAALRCTCRPFKLCCVIDGIPGRLWARARQWCSA
jgi:hypothetical protein